MHVLGRIALPLAILAGGVAGFVALAGQRQAPQRNISQAAEAPLVETVAVAPLEGGLDIEADGLVVPFREIRLSAEVGGPITYKAEECRAGRFVTQGTVLYEIDRRDYELEQTRLQKELDQADVTLEELEVESANTQRLITLAEQELKLQQGELQRLLRLDRGVVTQSAVDQARRQELIAQNSLTTLNNQLNLLNTRRARLQGAKEFVAAQLEKADLDLARTKIVAPIDGVVVEDLVEKDSYVQAGTELVRIEDTSKAEVRCSLMMEDLFWIWQQSPEGAVATGVENMRSDYRLPPTPVTVTYRVGGQSFTWDGVLDRYDGIGLDERTRTVPCRVVVENPRVVRSAGSETTTGPPALVRGMYVTLEVHVRPDLPLLGIPAQAVRPGNVVWTVQEGMLRVNQVDVAKRSGETVLVRADQSSLSAGDRAVVSPLASAHDDMPVREQAVP
jgi:RND family efflux transporter MFP subunit